MNLKFISAFKILMTLLVITFIFNSAEAKKKEKFTYIKMSTSYGNCILKLYNETPLHRDNFIKLTKQGFYDSLLFHRVISNFMIQGGDPNSKKAASDAQLGNGDVGYTIPAEFNDSLIHKKGALAAARDNNPAKASSGCQFYISQGQKITDAQLDALQKRNNMVYSPSQRLAYTSIGGTPHLDRNYTVFGEVVSGIEVVDAIANEKVGAADRPVSDIRMQMSVLKKYKVKKQKK